MKILNLYAGIGGNRKLWGDKHEVTAIEIDPKIAKIYQDFFPNDKVIITDAHKYLLQHFKEFDFIWSSPPCKSHSAIRRASAVSDRGQHKPIYPNMELYQEILFLNHYFKGKWVVENVIGYYEPLIKPIKIQRYYFWSNINLTKIRLKDDKIYYGSTTIWEKERGVSLKDYKNIDKRAILRNMVNPKLGLHIFQMAFKDKQTKLP